MSPITYNKNVFIVAALLRYLPRANRRVPPLLTLETFLIIIVFFGSATDAASIAMDIGVVPLVAVAGEAITNIIALGKAIGYATSSDPPAGIPLIPAH
ncbi:hypothetical protein [Escherichia coli]|uniref:hypothetical protein n=1 Tax=Escherichia coli TaxID=562 RepID=UPI00374CC6F5